VNAGTLVISGDHSAAAGAQVTRVITGALTNTAGPVLHLTAASAPAPGGYVLATANGGTSALPMTVTGFTGDVLSIPGNNLVLTVSGSDGIANLLEFALGGGPAGLGYGPAAQGDRGHHELLFRLRSVGRIRGGGDPDDRIRHHTGVMSILCGDSRERPPVSGPPVTIKDKGDGSHHVKVTVPKAGETKLFGRLKASK
jgi:hypothetical protein